VVEHAWALRVPALVVVQLEGVHASSDYADLRASNKREKERERERQRETERRREAKRGT
jgi:hypothetical protein